MNAIDTNIWIYAYDDRDLAKQQRAKELISTTRPLALIWQVGCEFIAASRKLGPLGFSKEQAWAAHSKMRSMSDVILIPNVDLWDKARGLSQTHSLSFWDAMILGAYIMGGVNRLYTEDMGGQPSIEGVHVINPFSNASQKGGGA